MVRFESRYYFYHFKDKTTLYLNTECHTALNHTHWNSDFKRGYGNPSCLSIVYQ